MNYWLWFPFCDLLGSFSISTSKTVIRKVKAQVYIDSYNHELNLANISLYVVEWDFVWVKTCSFKVSVIHWLKYHIPQKKSIRSNSTHLKPSACGAQCGSDSNCYVFTIHWVAHPMLWQQVNSTSTGETRGFDYLNKVLTATIISC